MLTGVFNDDQSKIIRAVCFGVLILGMLWAGWHYFRASILADTTTPLDPDMFQDVQAQRNDSALQRIVDLAQTVDSMRGAGETIARTLAGIHNMPFNLDPEDGSGIPFGSPGMAGSTAAPPADTKPSAGSLTVKMIMTADDGQKIAVVDGGGKKAVVLRRGDEIPGGGGFVSSIRPDGITVIADKQELKYEVPEIPMYSEFTKSNSKHR